VIVELTALRKVWATDVHKGGRLAATLCRVDEGLEFAYRPDWVSAGGRPVATTLPVGAGPVLRAGGALPAFFAGLLPEGRRLGALRRAVKTSADDELTLLLAVGADTIGDVTVVPSGTNPAEVPPRVRLDELDQVRFADVLTELGIVAQRVGLPGVQDKTSAAMINLPVARAGERWILKLNPAEYPNLVENEAFFLTAARASGLSTTTHQLVHDADGAAGLLVQRFDRITVDGAVIPLAVEDGCQVSNRPPADKYLLDAVDVFKALTAPCDARVLAGRDFLAQLAFAYLIGNGDAHAKNFSILAQPDGEWRASPVYDTPSTHPYDDTTLALSVAGRSDPDLGAADFVMLGSALGVPEKAVRRVLSGLADRVDSWLPGLIQLPFDRRRTTKLRRLIEYRRARLAPAPPTSRRIEIGERGGQGR
jgi:serine/threonine-protein kinase HipA